MREIYLYSTAGCHLCELAKEIVQPLVDTSLLKLKEVDIAESDELIERYGIRIPVLKFSDCGAELGWPFSSDQAAHFLARLD